jgi:DNA invertase Pin-like site-specific DNA recombinase
VGNLIVRDVDDDLIARLHERAAAHGRSAEAEHGADLRSLAEPELDTKGDFAELVLTMLGVTAKLERRRILERTARGRADAKAQGVKFGRKPKFTPHQQREAREPVAAAETQRSVARSYNGDQATISRLTA